jgi:DNA repair protein RAD5
VLQTGLDIVVSLSVYILPKAFMSVRTSSDDGRRNVFDEGAETLDEQELRERKSSLLKLFNSVGLRPSKGNTLLGKNNENNLDPDQVLKWAQGAVSAQLKNDIGHIDDTGDTLQVTIQNKNTRKEIVGDGEEIEIEADGEDLSDNELNMIYRRCVYTTKLN